MRPFPAVLLVLAVALGGCRATPGAERPNFILMLADDLGYGDLRCTGHPYAKTPSIDRLASEGTLFLNFYQAGATCVPTRTALMTGRFPARFPKHPLYFGFEGAVTITELLRREGYRTGHFGKWHIGPVHALGPYGIDSVAVMGGAPRSPQGRDAAAINAAIEFIGANRERPFYVNIWFNSVHYKIYPHASFKAPFAHLTVRRADFPNPDMQEHFNAYEALGGDLDEGMKNYLAEVLQLDSQVARVLKAIEEFGLREKTIVAFTSDNGPGLCTQKTGPTRTVLRENMLGSAGPFRGRKHDYYDGGIHQALIVRWPGHVMEGRVDDTSVVAGVDWLPTLCTVAGISFEPRGFDGEDVSDIWLGSSRGRRKDLFWRGVSSTDRPVILRGSWKLHLRPRGVVKLYDLAGDPGERDDLADVHPATAQDLREALEQWNSSLPASHEGTPGDGADE
jgi:arylsulfatase A-like enzyme